MYVERKAFLAYKLASSEKAFLLIFVQILKLLSRETCFFTFYDGWVERHEKNFFCHWWHYFQKHHWMLINEKDFGLDKKCIQKIISNFFFSSERLRHGLRVQTPLTSNFFFLKVDELFHVLNLISDENKVSCYKV